MDWVIVAGSVSLGVILGWMAYVVFAGESNIKTLTALVGVFGGAVIAGIFQAIAGTKAALPREVWFYPVGLLTGIGFTAFMRHLRDTRAQEKERQLQEAARQRQEEAQSQERLRAEEDSRKNSLRNLIEGHLRNKRSSGGKPITMVSFATLRSDLGRADLTDDALGALVESFPNVFCHRTLYGGQRGIGLAGHPALE